MTRIVGFAAATLVAAVLLTFYATGPSRTASGKRCPTPDATAAATFCLVNNNGHLVLARRTNAWERFKGSLTGNP
jgi:hypothetical protein